ncbi:lipase family protein [Aminipila sp.]|uniref:lipase family protein n=1 Tax=Aminipila sp. TaxID=2060095 RepID=UPI00289B9E40|nr:lipase family protein [Aminipila sp.]
MMEKIRLFLIIFTIVLAFGLIPMNLNTVFATTTPDSLFEQSSTEFNLDLAKYSLTLSSAAYGNTAANIEKVLTENGFTNDTTYDNTSYKNASRMNTNLVAYSFAHKQVKCQNREYTLIAVVIRGTSGDNEWISNFNINDSGSSPAIHEGFSKAEKALLANLNKYIKSLNLDRLNTKFLITGHSRGAAVANLLAADLSKSEKLADQSDIYGYTFATPNVAKISSNVYFNIFNAVNPADIVTEIPLAKWGYSKYGVTYSLPDETQIKVEDLTAAKKALSQLTEIAPTVKDFNKAKLSLALLEENLIPTGTTSAHAPQVYMKYLNEVNSDELSAKIFNLQLKLIPNKNYA